jgi:hypothetical protein
MTRSVPLAALAGFFIVVGIVFFVLAFKSPKAKAVSNPPKKAELRAQAERQTESGKMRIAGLLFFVFGVILFFAS